MESKIDVSSILQPSDLFGQEILPECTFESEYGKLKFKSVFIPDFSKDEIELELLTRQFGDIKAFMNIMNGLLKPSGKMICSDFHPFTKISDILGLQQPTMSYFSTDIFEGEMAHARFYDEEIRKQIPKCHYRKYTISEIINSIIGSGFTLERFDEHPSWENEKLPGEFTAIARKKA